MLLADCCRLLTSSELEISLLLPKLLFPSSKYSGLSEVRRVTVAMATPTCSATACNRDGARVVVVGGGAGVVLSVVFLVVVVVVVKVVVVVGVVDVVDVDDTVVELVVEVDICELDVV